MLETIIKREKYAQLKEIFYYFPYMLLAFPAFLLVKEFYYYCITA